MAANEAESFDADSMSEDDDDPEVLGLDNSQPEFYDPDADEKDKKWMAKMRKGGHSDAILSCPLCLSTVCIDCQQHAKHENQFRAMLVMNCRVDAKQIVKPAPMKSQGKGRKEQDEEDLEQYNPVHCAACDTEIGLRELPPSGIYHFFNVIPTNA